MIKFITLAVLLATTTSAVADIKCTGTVNATFPGIVGTYDQPMQVVQASADNLAEQLDNFTVKVKRLDNGCTQIEVVKK